MENWYSKNSKVDIFKSIRGETLGVQMVGRDNKEAIGYDETYYLNTEKFEAVRLPLEQGNCFFEIFLPKEQFDLKTVNDEFSLKKLHSYNEEFKPQKCYGIFFPAFEIDNEFTDLEVLMNDLGVESLLEDWDALNRLIANDYPLKGTTVKQSSRLEVDEHGIKSEAITRLWGTAGAPESGDYIIFKANRPFLFLLREVKNNKIYC